MSPNADVQDAVSHLLSLTSQQLRQHRAREEEAISHSTCVLIRRLLFFCLFVSLIYAGLFLNRSPCQVKT